MDLFPWTRSNLRILLDRETAARVLEPMNKALLLYFEPSAGMAPATLEDLRTAFANIRKAARSAFLDVDRALKEDFSLLLALKAPLEGVLTQVPAHCRLLLP